MWNTCLYGPLPGICLELLPQSQLGWSKGHGQVSWVRFLQTANLFTILYFHIKTSKFSISQAIVWMQPHPCSTWQMNWWCKKLVYTWKSACRRLLPLRWNAQQTMSSKLHAHLDNYDSLGNAPLIMGYNKHNEFHVWECIIQLKF